MFPENFSLRKLSSLLRPWLTHEPELEVKLGFIRSHAIARNLRFDVSALDRLISGCGVLLSFKSVMVEELSIHVALWSFPAFIVEVRGVNVTFSAGEPPRGRVSSRVEESIEAFLDDGKRKKLAKIDPEGSALHDKLGNIMADTPSRNWLKNSVLNVLLSHCRLQMRDIHLRTDFPVSDDPVTWILDVMKFNAEGQHVASGGLLGGFVGSFFRPLRESCFSVGFEKVEIRADKESHDGCIFTSMQLNIAMRFWDLHLIYFTLSLPEMKISIVPVGFPLLLALWTLFPMEAKHTRNGRHLWRIARCKIGRSFLLSRYRLHKIFSVAVLGLRLAKAYGHFFQLLGYPKDDLLQKRVVKMSEDGDISKPFKRQWKVISEIENQLPAEAIVWARSLGRSNAAVKTRHAEDGIASSTSSHHNFLLKLFLLLAVVLRAISKIPECIATVFSSTKSQDAISEAHWGSFSEDSTSHFGLRLHLGKIVAMISPLDAHGIVVHKKLKFKSHTSHPDLVLFCLFTEGFLFCYEDGIFENNLSFSLEHLNVLSAPVLVSSEDENNLRRFYGFMKGNWSQMADDSRSVIWVDPTPLFSNSDSEMSSVSNAARNVAVQFMEKLLGDMWSMWKRLYLIFHGIENQYTGNPWLICAVKSLMVFPTHNSVDCGLLKCSLAMGKLNFVLGSSSVQSLSLLIKQMQDAFCHFNRLQSARVLSHSAGILQELPEMNRNIRFQSMHERMKMAIFELLPNKQIELVAVIIGPRVQISLRREVSFGSTSGINPAVCQDCFNLAFTVDNVDLAVWPTCESRNPRYADHGGNFTSLGSPKRTDNFEANVENSASQGQITIDYYFRFGGVNAYFENSGEEKLQMQILELKPITIEISSSRDYLYSFGAIAAVLSVALGATAEGFTVSMSMDELAIIFEVVEGMFSELSTSPFGSSCLDPRLEDQASIKKDILRLETESEEMIVDGREGEASNITSASLILTGRFQLDCFDIILQGSHRTQDKESLIKLFYANSRLMSLPQLPENGIWLCIMKTIIEISYEERKVEVHADISGSQAVMLRYKTHTGEVTDQVRTVKEALQSFDYSCEVSVSGCTFTLMLDCPEEASSSGLVAASSLFDSLSVSANEGVVDSSEQKDAEQNLLALFSGNWLLVSLSCNEIFMGKSSIKNLFVHAHHPNRLLATLSLGGDFQRIYLKIQDGFLFLETAVLVIFAHSLTSYLQCIMHLLSISSLNGEDVIAPDQGGSMSTPGGNHIDEPMLEEVKTKSELLEALEANLSQLCLVFLQADESGRVREIVWNVDLRLSFGLENAKRKFLFNLVQLKILSEIIDDNLEHTAIEVHIPHFSPGLQSYFSSEFVKEQSPEVQNVETTLYNTASCSKSSAISAAKPVAIDPSTESLHASKSRFILKELSAFATAEKPAPRDGNNPYLGQGWAGSGAVSGFDVTVSLTELKMLIDASESLSEVFGKKSSYGIEKRARPFVQEETLSDPEALVPDGAIVAIQDTHQHLYVTLERTGDKYGLTGAIHYSLVGDRALFKVEYQKQRRWNFDASWFLLVSLHAMSDSGENMQLNCHPGSGFVHISNVNQSSSALWKIVSSKPENYEGDINMESSHLRSKSTFYLVNKKNGCGVAFVDGIPEFVRKPGHSFKLKVFSDTSSPPVMSDVVSAEANSSNQLLANHKLLSRADVHPVIILKLDKTTFTIVHELWDQKENFPLIQGCINNFEVNVQVQHCKIRVMSTLTTMFYYFDAKRIQWVELVHPIETYILYRSRFHSQVTQTVPHGTSVRFYLRMKEIDVLLTELSLDILLFVIGKLDLAGPFDVKTSSILANTCKVENQSGLSLLCEFYDAQIVRLGRKQSAFFPFRHSVGQSLEQSYMSIKVEELGKLSTSSVQLPLSETRAFAWRMRIISLKDAVTHPGPFMVFEVSKNAEEGLSVLVSPLLRVHNVTEFCLELRFQRPQQESESASVLLQARDTIDDCIAAFDAVNGVGGFKKALVSLCVGNVVFSFRPQIKGDMRNSDTIYAVEWSEDRKWGKAFHLSGVLDKLAYKVRDAFSADSWKCTFSTAHCVVRSGDSHVFTMYFLVQSLERDVPIKNPGDDSKSSNSVIAIQAQKEIFLLPTVRVSNLLQLDVHVLLNETDACPPEGFSNIGNEATVPCGSTIELYANPAILYFTFTLVAFNSSCKPVNSGDWVKMLNKQKDNIQFFDIDLEFSGGYFASLRLIRGDRGTLEAVIFSSYALKNDTDFPLLCLRPNQKSLSRDEAERLSSGTLPHLGSSLPPRSIGSWFMKSNKLCLKLLDEDASLSMLDLDTLSGLAEINLSKDGEFGFKHIIKLGVSLGPLTSKMFAPSRVVTLVPRYIIANESDSSIYLRQCFPEGDLEDIVEINSEQKTALILRDGPYRKREVAVFDKIFRKHRFANDDSSTFIQFRPNKTGLGWSGPVCVASLGRFFLKFKRSFESSVHQSNPTNRGDGSTWDFAVVHVVEEASSFVLHFRRPPDIDLPYRIENHLLNASITYYQKDTFESESLAADNSTDYVWDDLTRPHKLIVRIDGFHTFREINLDKLRSWKPFFKGRQQIQLPYYLPQQNEILEGRSDLGQSTSFDIGKVGYEVYADGPTRILRICDLHGARKGDKIIESCVKVQFRVSNFTIHLLEHIRQDLEKDVDLSSLTNMPIVVGRLENIDFDTILVDQWKHYRIRLQSINVDQKRVGAPFGAMFRRHKQSESSTEGSILLIVCVLDSTSSGVRKVKYSSILLQPVDLNLDEETLMRIMPFWRTSLNQSTQSQQYYFDHFEIHPIKVIASFIPEESYSSYSSAQETLRSLLHSVIKIPPIKSVVVELNGVLVTHALVTTRELLLKCAQHYSWYAMRTIYIAKGSRLLPPTFASVFDDLASSSLDVFFDPSSLNVQGLTLGTFKLISNYIEGKGFSGTKRYFGDLGDTLRTAGSNILFTAVTEISDSVLKGAEGGGFNGMITGFHHGILKLAMEPSFLRTAFIEGGPDRKIKLDQTPGVDELYVEGYLQAMLDTVYKQEYLRVRVVDNQVILKNLPPNSALIDEIMDRVKDFLISKGLLKGDSSTTVHPLRHLRVVNEWRIGPTVLTLCEHLFVSFAIRMLRKQAGKVAAKFGLSRRLLNRQDGSEAGGPASTSKPEPKGKLVWRWGIGKFIMSALVAYVDGRLCRGIPNPIARRIVSGFLLSFLNKNETE
ncbi:hypothetical protein Dimus_017083 [Dionaea muscipula]